MKTGHMLCYASLPVDSLLLKGLNLAFSLLSESRHEASLTYLTSRLRTLDPTTNVGKAVPLRPFPGQIRKSQGFCVSLPPHEAL